MLTVTETDLVVVWNSCLDLAEWDQQQAATVVLHSLHFALLGVPLWSEFQLEIVFTKVSMSILIHRIIFCVDCYYGFGLHEADICLTLLIVYSRAVSCIQTFCCIPLVACYFQDIFGHQLLLIIKTMLSRL